jgi:hypothetical protein
LFGGASSLYRFNLADNSVTELIPFDAQSGKFLCLDDLSADERLLADHCAGQSLTIRDLAGGQASTIEPPAQATGFNVLGSARFNADGSRLAFALAKGDPSAEQGWVAVSDGLSGGSRLVATSQPGEYFTVIGWLGADALLLQSSGVAPDNVPSVWEVSTSTGSLARLAEGTFLAVVQP